ncbi:hypothetical protein, partial [Candidatus Ichthyocystis hellenicum]|uniref:hypothetical protein n=1 Tax=Candidatus Ichthyocystis hellenicum TaxID=1561003 RepID=UPI0011118C2C
MDNKKPSNYGSHLPGPFSGIEHSASESESESELEQSDEAEDVDVTYAETQMLSFSDTVARNLLLNRDLLLNLLQENGRRLAGIICANYGYSVFTADIGQCFSRGFFQDYALRNGYSLTPNFLLRLNGLRTLLSDNIDRLFTSNNFDSFLVEVDRSNLLPSQLSILLNNYSLNFSNSAVVVRSSSIDFLRSTIIPALVGIINQNTVVRGSNECELRNSDKEQLFLYVATVFERLAMLRLMIYWNSFCAINQDLLSLLPATDYSNPFVVARDKCDFIIPDVRSPAAFTTVHGINLSFMAVNYLDGIIENIASTVMDVLRPVILEKVTRICSDHIFLKELRESGNRALLSIIREEFSRLIASHVDPQINRFLNESLIWSQGELSSNELQPFVTGVISAIYRSIENNLISCCSSIIGSTADSTRGTGESGIGSTADNTRGTGESGTVSEKEHVKTRSDPRSKLSLCVKCGFDLDEEFFEGLRPIISRELSSLRLIAREKFTAAITSGNLSNLVWRDQSIVLMPDINAATREYAISAMKRLKRDHIPKARIVCASGKKKKLNHQQRCVLLENVSIYLNGRFRDNLRKLWRQIVEELSSAGLISGVSSAVSTGVSSAAAGSSGVSAAGSNRVSVIVGTGVVSTAASSSAASAVPTSSRDESSQASSSTVSGKSKGRKRKRSDTTDVASAEG